MTDTNLFYTRTDIKPANIVDFAPERVYKTWGIEWIDYLHCYRVYDLVDHRTVAYDDGPVETIINRLETEFA